MVKPTETSHLLHTAVSGEFYSTPTPSTRSRWKVAVTAALAIIGGSAAIIVLDKSSRATKGVAFPMELEGSSKSACEDGRYSKRTLKLAFELPFVSLFRNPKGQSVHEVSSITVKDGMAYAICDSSWAISKFDMKLQPYSDRNVLVGDPERPGQPDDSGYEALFEEDNTFYAVRESIWQKSSDSYHAVIEELQLDDSGDSYEVLRACPCEYEFEGDSKGFEGAAGIHDLSGELFVLGLCEGNYCSEKRKDETGNGRIIVMRKNVTAEGKCQWQTVRKIKLPKTANFHDYSAVSIDETGRVAITSQEDSQLWVGQLTGRNPAGLYDIANMQFDPDVGEVYDFPKNDNCQTVYCNIEGVHWINEDMVIAVSDKMKGKGKQDFRCFNKDQSVHVFVLP